MLLDPNRLLRKMGYEIRRIPVEHSYPPPPDAERMELEAALHEFARREPADSPCSDAGALRRYLSNRRIALFNDLLEQCHREGIAFAGRGVADVGSGTGYLLRLVGQRASDARLTGYDTFGDLLGLAQRLCPEASFFQRDLFEIATEFDVVFCTETLEHLERPAAALRALFDLVTPGGALVITVPDGRIDQHASGERREDGTAYWGHIHFWSPESWRLFVAGEIGGRARIVFGQCATGENYAMVFRPAGP